MPRNAKSKAEPAIEFAQQAEKLALHNVNKETYDIASSQAVRAHFVTDHDPIIQTADGARLPVVPVEEALKLNKLRDQLEDRGANETTQRAHSNVTADARAPHASTTSPGAPLKDALPPSRTNPLFPPLPMYGPPTLLRRLQCHIFQIVSFFGSTTFLAIIVLGAMFTYALQVSVNMVTYLTCRNPRKKRPFYERERRRAQKRRDTVGAWRSVHRAPRNKGTHTPTMENADQSPSSETEQDANGRVRESYEPTEGGNDPLICDLGYYAREEGLDCETFHVQTEDGFIIELWHIYNPLTYTARTTEQRKTNEPNLFPDSTTERIQQHGEGYNQHWPKGQKKYPVLLLHGLLQSSGAFCCTGSSSLAFYLAKSGYDVWLGNSRCGFNPRHSLLHYSDPRMWAWNIRQMGVLDLPALVSRVLVETGFSKCALIAHSQGTTQTMVALAKEQRPELGQKLSVVCLLAPAAYAGPLIGKAYFKFMRLLSPSLFRMVFGIHSFIPVMLTMHRILPGSLYGFMGYRVFSFLFNWTDKRWDRGLRDRCFQFAPVYVSAESMRWWLGKDCFAKHKCILATRRETEMEDAEDREENPMDGIDHKHKTNANSNKIRRRSLGHEKGENGRPDARDLEEGPTPSRDSRLVNSVNTSPNCPSKQTSDTERGRFAWYDNNAPPFAFWVAGNDELVDGQRLLKRFERGREPYVNVVHKKIIPEYEHLDVIWAIDSIEQVGKEVSGVIWKTVDGQQKAVCRTPWLDWQPDP